MYVVKKPLSIGGRRRAIGELLSDDEVKGGSIVRSGYVAQVDSGLLDLAGEAVLSQKASFSEGSASALINLPVIDKNGNTVISVAPEAIQEAVRLVQLTAKEASKQIEEDSTLETLAVLRLIEARKEVRSAVNAKTSALEQEENGSAGEA